nr:hypothetical protein CFP56_18418 [Quercus suber]
MLMDFEILGTGKKKSVNTTPEEISVEATQKSLLSWKKKKKNKRRGRSLTDLCGLIRVEERSVWKLLGISIRAFLGF